MDKTIVLQHMTDAAHEAAKLMLEAHGVMAEKKSSCRDVVTECDRRVQELLMRRLREAAPQARFFCEEQERNGDPLPKNPRNAAAYHERTFRDGRFGSRKRCIKVDLCNSCFSEYDRLFGPCRHILMHP